MYASGYGAEREETMQDLIKIHEDDNVAVALRQIAAGETLTVAGEPVVVSAPGVCWIQNNGRAAVCGHYLQDQGPYSQQPGQSYRHGLLQGGA